MFGRPRRTKKARSWGSDGGSGEPQSAATSPVDKAIPFVGPLDNTIPIFSLLTPPEVEQLGRIPVEAIIGEFLRPPRAGEPLDPASLRINGAFIKFLHVVIARWAPTSPDFKAAVEAQRDGYVYVLDGRTPTPQGEVPPEDVIGRFEVQAGKVVATSYEACPGYKAFTKRGVIQLTPFLRERFFYELQQLSVD